MGRFARIGGTAGIVAGLAFLLRIYFVQAVSAEGFALLNNPARAFPILREQQLMWSLAGLTSFIGFVAGALFVLGMYHHVRAQSSEGAHLLLFFGVAGFGIYALWAVIFWRAPLFLLTIEDQGMAAQALLTVRAVTVTMSEFALAFVALFELVTGWLIIRTKALSPVLGWVAIAAAIFRQDFIEFLPVVTDNWLTATVGALWFVLAGLQLRGAERPAMAAPGGVS